MSAGHSKFLILSLCTANIIWLPLPFNDRPYQFTSSSYTVHVHRNVPYVLLSYPPITDQDTSVIHFLLIQWARVYIKGGHIKGFPGVPETLWSFNFVGCQCRRCAAPTQTVWNARLCRGSTSLASQMREHNSHSVIGNLQ